MHLLNIYNDKKPHAEDRTDRQIPRGTCTLQNLNVWEQTHTRDTQYDKSCVVIWGFIDSVLCRMSKYILEIENSFKIITEKQTEINFSKVGL